MDPSKRITSKEALMEPYFDDIRKESDLEELNK